MSEVLNKGDKVDKGLNPEAGGAGGKVPPDKPVLTSSGSSDNDDVERIMGIVFPNASQPPAGPKIVEGTITYLPNQDSGTDSTEPGSPTTGDLTPNPSEPPTGESPTQ